MSAGVIEPVEALVPRDGEAPTTAALRAFVRAYANTEQLDDDAVEIELFKAWLAGSAALGLKPSPQPRPRRRSIDR